MALPMLMGEWAVLMEAIRLRLDQIERVDPDSLDGDALADLYEDQDTLTRMLAYIESGLRALSAACRRWPSSGCAACVWPADARVPSSMVMTARSIDCIAYKTPDV